MGCVVSGLMVSCAGGDGKSEAYGTFEAVEITVAPEIPGKLLSLDIEEGMVCKAGQATGLVDTTDFYLKKQALEAQQSAVGAKLGSIMAQADVQVQQKMNLEVDQQRLLRLFADKAATQKQLDDMSGNLKLLEKQVKATLVQRESVLHEKEALGKQIAQVEEALRKCHIICPIDGTVLAKYSEASEIVAAGKPLYKIADLKEMILRVYISGSQLPHVAIGQKVEVLIDEDKKLNRTLSGTVSWISSSAEFTPKIIQTKEERVNLVYAVKVRVVNDGSLKIAMPGEVNFK